MERKIFTVEEEYGGERLDKYLSIALPLQSRSFYQRLIKEEHVWVNDVFEKANYRIESGDVITLDIPDPVQVQIHPENIPLDILYEDDDVLIVNKPKNMVVHPAVGHYTGTLVNAVMYHCKDSLSGINGEIRPGVVHRIDKDTTGSLIICKNDDAHIKIAEQIKAHTVTRKYVGVVAGTFHDLEGTVTGPIGRHPNDRKKMTINPKNGKDAVTHYRVLETLNGASYMEFQLETGRTHQIRVHMASISHPLLGDPLYGSGKNPYHLEGQALHAKTIGFIHPTTGEYLEVSAPVPQYMEELVKKLR